MVFSTPRKRATKRFYIEPHLGSVLNAVCFLSLKRHCGKFIVFLVIHTHRTLP